MRLAACVLVDRCDRKILCVSRYENLSDWNLPGGKREPGESSVFNAIRELEEETGIIAYPYELKLINSGPCAGDFFVDTYMIGFDYTFGVPRSSDEGTVDWKDWSDLLSEKSSFHEYNRELFAKVASA